MNWPVVFVAMLPEHLLLLGIVALLIQQIMGGPARGTAPIALATLIVATVAAALLAAFDLSAAPFAGHYSVNPLTLLAKAVVLAIAAPVVLLAKDQIEPQEPAEAHFHMLMLASLYGVCLLMSADSFLTLFLGLEMMSLPVYALLMLGRRGSATAEAALKYLVLGGAATASFLMGASLLYGATGELSLATFALALPSQSAMQQAAVVLIVVSFFVKAAVVPFHAWAPDAYEGASVPATAYMATAIKAGALLAAARLFGEAPLSPALAAMIAVLPLVSMVWGNLAAMRQSSFRRMIAYSSIAHAGYLFFAFLGAGPTRMQAVVFYVLAYGLMNLLAFAALPPHADDAQRDQLVRFKGLAQRQPYAALAIAVAMLSLAGIPPLPGFIAKFLIFKNVVAAGYTLWAVLGLIASYLGIYFYLRVIQTMYMGEPATTEGGVLALRRAAVVATVLCLVPAALLALFPGAVLGWLG